MEQVNGLPEHLRFAATLAKAVIEQCVVITPERENGWIESRFIDEQELAQVKQFVAEWSD